jgi:hypothetical protein
MEDLNNLIDPTLDVTFGGVRAINDNGQILANSFDKSRLG